jgi:Protein of unknown function (DUF3866)
MVAFRSGVVREILDERRGLQKVGVEIAGKPARAYVLTDVIGEVDVGDAIVCNTTAVDLDLGTGGWHFVHWNLARSEFVAPGPGHIMKLRYTSLQVDVGSTEEHTPALGDVTDCSGLPVVAAGLHSQIAGIAVGVRHRAPRARVAYVMTDGAALPLALSDLVHELCRRGLIDVTITCGHAFGGDHEAVSLASALAIARHVERADVAIVAMGPGIVGTGTALGTTGLELAAIVDTAGALAGRAVVALRTSDADPRDRHRGISHHAVTALGLAARRATIAVPPDADDLRAELTARGVLDRHEVVECEIPDVVARFEALSLRVTSMGRPAADDRILHACAAAAGVLAASYGTDEVPTVEFPSGP